jgi:hypothetical protein
MRWLWSVQRTTFDVHAGGGEIVAWHCVEALRTAGDEVHWWTPEQDLAETVARTKPDVLFLHSDFLVRFVRQVERLLSREGHRAVTTAQPLSDVPGSARAGRPGGLTVVVNIGTHRHLMEPYRLADVLVSQWQGESIDRLSAAVQPVHYWPHACNPRYHYCRDTGAAPEWDLVFVGRAEHRDSDAYRQHLAPHADRLHLVGIGWPEGAASGPVHFRHIARVYNNARACLNFHNDEQKGADRMFNARVWECAACGKPQVCDVELPFDDSTVEGRVAWAAGETYDHRVAALRGWVAGVSGVTCQVSNARR